MHKASRKLLSNVICLSIIFSHTHTHLLKFPHCKWLKFERDIGGGIKYQHLMVICTNEEIAQNEVPYSFPLNPSSPASIKHSFPCHLCLLLIIAWPDSYLWEPAFRPSLMVSLLFTHLCTSFSLRFKVCYFTSPNILFLVITQCLTFNWYSQGTLLIGLEWKMKQMNLLPISKKNSPQGWVMLFSRLTISL